MEKKQSTFPTNHVVGFFLSIAMTALAVIVAFRTNFSGNVIMWIVGTLAIFQAGVQLFMFMHINEGKDGKTNYINIIYSVLMALVIVFGSIWILTTGHAAH